MHAEFYTFKSALWVSVGEKTNFAIYSEEQINYQESRMPQDDVAYFVLA